MRLLLLVLLLACSGCATRRLEPFVGLDDAGERAYWRAFAVERGWTNQVDEP